MKRPADADGQEPSTAEGKVEAYFQGFLTRYPRFFIYCGVALAVLLIVAVVMAKLSKGGAAMNSKGRLCWLERIFAFMVLFFSLPTLVMLAVFIYAGRVIVVRDLILTREGKFVFSHRLRTQTYNPFFSTMIDRFNLLPRLWTVVRGSANWRDVMRLR